MSPALDLDTKLHDYLHDAHAMEKSVLRQLGSLLATTRNQQLHAALERHQALTRQQIARLEERLEAHNEDPSAPGDVGAQFAAFFKALGSILRSDKPVRNAKDVFVAEHLEIAAYEVLERLALSARDPETARVARENRAEEEEMARIVSVNWDTVVDEMLAEEHLLEQAADRSKPEEVNVHSG
jgi:ferritin-like metal-binding protein YciE